MVDQLSVFFPLLQLSLKLFDERFSLFGYEMGSIQVHSLRAQVLLGLAHFTFEPLRKLLVCVVLARSLLQLTLEPADLAFEAHLYV